MNSPAHDQSNQVIFPTHLQSYQSLVEHIDSLLDGQSTTEKGDKFARFVARLLPQTSLGTSFGTPQLRPVKSHDQGVDLIAEGKDGKSVLYIQAKKRISSAKDIREVVDGFNEFMIAESRASKETQSSLFDMKYEPIAHCLLFTLSNIEGIVKAYEERPSATKSLYDQLKSEQRLHVIDGEDIFAVLKSAFVKVSEVPYQLVVNLAADPSSKNGVYVGVISSDELKRLYREHNEALFFENVRDFLGVEVQKQKGRTTPNQEIVRTITEQPTVLLARNNGIVMKATQIKMGTDSRQLILARGGIVNGCQTTKCIVEYATTLCYVPIKIVETSIDEAWNITKAANYQTAVPDIDLEIARSLRPQLLRRYGLVSSTEVEHGAKSALQLLDDLYQRKVTYDETRLLYIGLFSRSPNNLIAGNYTELHPELIRKFFEADPYGEAVFRVLLNLQTVSESAKERVEKVFHDKKVFSRYYEVDAPIYRCLVSLLALCGSTETDLSDRVQVGLQRHNRGQSRLDVDEEYKRMRRFLAEAETILNEHPDTYIDYYVAAFNVWMREIGSSAEDEAEARQNMYSRTKSMSFSHAYSTLVDDVRTMRAMSSKQ